MKKSSRESIVKAKNGIKIDNLIISKKNFFGCLFVLLIWTLPNIYNGFMHKDTPGFPKVLTHIHSLSNLFTHAVPVWPYLYVQVRHPGEEEWLTLDTNNYFQMETFGHRTRFFEAIFVAVDDTDVVAGIRKDLAIWIARKYTNIHKIQYTPANVRFLAGLYTVTPDNQPKGRWKTPPITSLSEEQLMVLSIEDTGWDLGLMNSSYEPLLKP